MSDDDAGSLPPDAGVLDASQPPFSRPDGGADYSPEASTCGFDKPAFCDAFELAAGKPGRSGELDVARWSGVRGGPWDHPDFDTAFPIGPALLPACRGDLPPTVLPGRDALICDPVPGAPTRHALITAAAQNYGLTGEVPRPAPASTTWVSMVR